jgi:hypothetical protein
MLKTFALDNQRFLFLTAHIAYTKALDDSLSNRPTMPHDERRAIREVRDSMEKGMDTDTINAVWTRPELTRDLYLDLMQVATNDL